jgi:hypothetical protein
MFPFLWSFGVGEGPSRATFAGNESIATETFKPVVNRGLVALHGAMLPNVACRAQALSDRAQHLLENLGHRLAAFAFAFLAGDCQFHALIVTVLGETVNANYSPVGTSAATSVEPASNSGLALRVTPLEPHRRFALALLTTVA